eukprot:Colp12_sorted_trinity150504_noHs@13397
MVLQYCTFLPILSISKKKTRKAMNDDTTTPEKIKRIELAASAADTFIWQSFASVIIPGVTINRVCALTSFALQRVLPNVPSSGRKWATTFVGLGMIPLIIHPIDHLVDYGMDGYYRPQVKKIIDGMKKESSA